MNPRLKPLVGVVLTISVCAVLAAQQRTRDGQAATVGRLSVSVAELERLADAKLMKVRAEEFAIKRRILDDRIALLLLQLESERRAMTAEELLRLEVDGKARPVTDEESKAVLENSRDRPSGVPEDVALRAIREGMARQRTTQRRGEYLNELRGRYPVSVLLDPPRVDIGTLNGPSRGSNDAPVTVVEFSDFQCPYCARMPGTLDSLLRKYDTKVRLVFKHYPLPIHRDAIRAAEAAVCAQEQNGFWKMHTILFANANALSAANMGRFAREANLDVTRFEACLSSGRAAEQVKRDRAEGEKYGVSNTPTYFINGRFVLGAVPLEAFTTIVDEELARVR